MSNEVPESPDYTGITAAKPRRPWFKMKRVWVLAIIALIVIISVSSGSKNNNNSGNSGTSSAQAPTSTQGPAASAGAALSAYFTQVNNDLSLCVAGIGATQLELAQALKTTATSSDDVNLYTEAKKAEGPCDTTQNNDLLNLGTLSPPSGYASLSNFSLDAQIWADSDSVTVLKDTEAIANNPGSTADAGNLITDSQAADGDGQALVTAAASAATQAGVKNIGGNMILTWGLSTK